MALNKEVMQPTSEGVPMTENFYAPPAATQDTETVDVSQIKRGGCLSTLLIIIIVSHLAGVVFNLVFWEGIRQFSPRAPRYWSYFFAFNSFLTAFFGFLIWKWKKVGIFGILAIVMLVFAAEIYLNFPVMTLLPGLLSPLILTLLVARRWKRFE